MKQLSMFAPQLPPGLHYEPDLISVEEEKHLLGIIARLNYKNYQYGEYTAHRKIAAYGMRDHPSDDQVPPLPDFIAPFIERIASRFHTPVNKITSALFTHYAKGVAIGWHSDAPMYESVFGISLLSDCTMDFRLKEGDQEKLLPVPLEARSVYAMTGPSRWPWQHRIAAVKAERYSITFRTLRPSAGG